MRDPQPSQTGHHALPPRRTRRWRDTHLTRRKAVAAAVAVLVILIPPYFAFGPGLPFQHHFQLRAIFANANELAPGSDVRIAGISIGSVDRVAVGPRHTAIVTIQVDNNQTEPIRADARLAVKPRLALEGNYYIDMSPGTPSSALLRSGATIPLSRTSGLVQIDQFVDTFTLPIRDHLTATVAQLASGLGRGPGGAAAPPGYAGLRQATDQLDHALIAVSQVAHSAQGTQPGDLSRALGSTGAFTAQLAERPAVLADLVSNFDQTFAALSASHAALGSSIAQIDDTLRAAPPQLTTIDSALPGLTTFAKALQPALQQAPSALDAANRLLVEMQRLVAPRELPSLLTALRPVTANLPTLEARLDALFPYLTPAMNCISRKVIPVLDATVPDGPNTTGEPAWLDLMHLGASLAGVAANFDGNGTAIRLGVSESENVLRGFIPGFGTLYTNKSLQGVDPVWLGQSVQPPNRPDAWCIDQPLPDLSARNDHHPPSEFQMVGTMSPKQRAEGSALGRIRAALASGNAEKLTQALSSLLNLQGVLKGTLASVTRATTALSHRLDLGQRSPAASSGLSKAPAATPTAPSAKPAQLAQLAHNLPSGLQGPLVK